MDKLEAQARQARQELKEQQAKSLEHYLERRAAEFRAAVAQLEVLSGLNTAIKEP